MSLMQRIALVTGANRGLGFEICRQLAGRGIHVILTSRDAERGRTAFAQLQAEAADVRYHQLDVTCSESIDRFNQFVEQEYGRLDILINNAGVMLADQGSFFETNLDTIRATMETNVYGPLRLCQVFVPLMKHHNYGRIVNISSGMGQLSDMGGRYTAYRMSKTCLNVLTRTLAAEMKGTNTLINSMCPGWVRSDLGGAWAPRSVEQGADTAIWLATLPDDGPQGGFFRDRKAIPW